MRDDADDDERTVLRGVETVMADLPAIGTI